MHFARLQTLYTTKKYPILAIKSGMFLELHEDVGEWDTKRIQKFKGLVIQVKKPNHPDGTFTIRGTVAGVIVEKIFPLSFEKFEKVILLDLFQTRRARINYIRDKIGKDAKMKSIITVDLKGKDLLADAREVFAQEESPQIQEATQDNEQNTSADSVAESSAANNNEDTTTPQEETNTTDWEGKETDVQEAKSVEIQETKEEVAEAKEETEESTEDDIETKTTEKE